MLNWPWWVIPLILGVENWPVALGVALGLVILAALTRSWVRWMAIAAALPGFAVSAVAAWWAIEARQRDRESAAFEARINQVLDRDEVVNGLHLPAGTAIRWRDVDHLRLAMADPPKPIVLFGLHASWVQAADDGDGWDLILPKPELIDGWTCKEIGVQVSPAGQLRSCQLAAGRAWKGWPIPAGTRVDLTAADKVGLVLPTGASVAAPEIGHALTDTGAFSINADGSLDQFNFEDDNPLAVAGTRLWNTVRWTYDPATFGQGRRRRAVTVHGYLAPENGTGGSVVIRLADGQVTAAE